MGRKKKFIDKEKATKYHLLHRESEGNDVEGSEYELVSMQDMQRRQAQAELAASSRHPLAFLYEEEEDMVQNDQEREEILDMGLPDDGYNYLKHMRVVGARNRLVAPEPTARDQQGEPLLEDREVVEDLGIAEGFQPPEEDVAFVDARALSVLNIAADDEAVKARRDDISAFSRPVRHAQKIANHAAVRELDAMMRQCEQYDDARQVQEAGQPEAVLGEGTLLDDFVLAASCADAVGEAEDGAGGPGLEGLPEDPQEWDFGSELETDSGSDGSEATAAMALPAGAPAARPRGPASVADSFWRAERLDRTDAQTVIDERLIHKMDTEYNDDDIGSLEDEEEGTRGQGLPEHGHVVQSAVADFLRTYKKGHKVGDLPMHWKLIDLTPDQLEALDDELVARIKAKEAYERQVAAEAARPAGADDLALDAMLQRAPEERWDCESVLSLRSSLSNHPRKIGDEGGSKGGRRIPGGAGARPAPVQLSAKTGLPLGVHGITMPKTIQEDEEEEGESEEEGLNLGAARGRGESKEDKKARKAAVKEARRMARATKKEMRDVYAQEHAKAQKLAATNKGANTSIMYIP